MESILISTASFVAVFPVLAVSSEADSSAESSISLTAFAETGMLVKRTEPARSNARVRFLPLFMMDHENLLIDNYTVYGKIISFIIAHT